MDFPKHYMPKCRCLNCGERIDGATSFSDKRAPTEGDITICIYCGHIMVFNDQGGLRAPNKDECYMIAGDPYILAFQRARAKLFEDDSSSSKK